MTATALENNHWKYRIRRRIDQVITSLTATEDPGFLDRVEQDARKRALESLAIADLHKRVGEIRQRRQDLDREENDTYRKMIATVNRCDISDVPELDRVHASRLGPDCLPDSLECAIARRQEIHERQLLGKSSLGRRLLQLRREQEELDDTVWLASSCKQIRELWQKAAELLILEPTPLQTAVLLIDPLDEDSE